MGLTPGLSKSTEASLDTDRLVPWRYHLDRHDDLDSALREWDAEQVELADRLLALGDQMERAFIWNSLDLTTSDAASTEAWWRAAVQFPDDFSYEADE